MRDGQGPIVKHPRTNPCIRARMWEKLRSYFKGYPAQEKVAQLMLLHGLRVRDGRVFAGPMEVSDTATARAASVDRRVVTATVETIESNPELLRIFERLAPVCHLGEVAPLMGWGAIEIIPTSASKPGILSGVATAIAEAGISIRQVIVDDPEVFDNPHAFIVTEQPVPERLLPRIRSVEGVKSVVLH